MTDVQCHVNNEGLAPRAVTFNGVTDKGIAMKASAADIVKAYGEPDADRISNRNSSYRTIAYFKLGLNFTLKADQLGNVTAFLPPSPELKADETQE